MFLVVNAKAKWDEFLFFSESVKIDCDLFGCPLIPNLLIRLGSRRLIDFEFIRAYFASLNPSQEFKIISVSFSIFELNKRLSRRNLHL